MAKAASDMRGGGAGGERDRIALNDHISRCHCNAALLVGESLFAEGEGCVETERLISQLAGQFPHRGCDAPDHVVRV